jgi:hypothetical protein
MGSFGHNKYGNAWSSSRKIEEVKREFRIRGEMMRSLEKSRIVRFHKEITAANKSLQRMA